MRNKRRTTNGKQQVIPVAIVAAICLAFACAAAAGQPAKSAPPKAAPATEPGDIEVEVIKPRPFSKPKEAPIPVTWRTDLVAAKEEAAKAGKPLLIFFHADWCQPCLWMDRGTFANPAVAQFVQRSFIPVKVDDSAETSAASKEYQVRLYPTLLFLDSAGQPLHMALGARAPEMLYPLLAQVADLPRLIDAELKAPDDLETVFAVGNAFAKLNQLKQAEPYLKRAAALAPNNENSRLSQASLLLAIVPMEDGDAATALKNIDAYLKKFPDTPESPTAMHYQGTILFRDGKLGEARKYFERLKEKYPKHPKAYEADKAIEAIDARLRAISRQKADPNAPAKPAEPAKPAPQPKG